MMDGARAQKADDAKYATPRPVGWNPPPVAPLVGDQDGANPVRDGVVNGLPSEHGEDVALRQPERLACAAKAAVLEGTQHGVTEACGNGAHAEPPRSGSPSLTANIKFVNVELLSAWAAWVDDEHRSLANELEHFDLKSLAAPTCAGASATDTSFAEQLIQSIWTDVDSGGVFRRRGGDAARRWEQYFARKPSLTLEEAEAIRAHVERLYPHGADAGSHVQVVRDGGHVFPGGAAEPFVRDYLRTLPLGWTASIVVSLAAGKNPVICRWTDQRMLIGVTRRWCESGPRMPNGEPRFEALEDHTFGDAVRVMVPAATAARSATVEEIAAPPAPRPAQTTDAVVMPTGIAALDSLLVTAGVPRGARVVVQAATAQGKTSVALEIAESLAERGARVVWYATSDEPRESILARRRQRVGMPRADALLSSDESMLDSRLFVVDGRKYTLEEVFECQGIDVLFVDPISKIRTLQAASDPVSRVGHGLDLIEASGWTCWMTAATVRAAGRRTATERALGGARIEAGCSLLLELSRSGSDLAISVLKSRLGGEGQEVRLKLDAERQRIVALPDGLALVTAAERIKSDVLRVVAERGPRSARSLVESVSGKHELVRTAVRELLAAGALVTLEGKKVGLP